MKSQILVGVIIILGCLSGWRNESLILKETTYGSILRRICGEERAYIGWRLLLLIGGIGGFLLASNFIRPLRW